MICEARSRAQFNEGPRTKGSTFVARADVKPERQLKKQYGLPFDAVMAQPFEGDLMALPSATMTMNMTLRLAQSFRDWPAPTVSRMSRPLSMRSFAAGSVAAAGPREAYGEASVKIWEAWQAAFPQVTQYEPREE
jgi:hypothetical protein